MLKIEHEFSNEGARAFENQLRKYLGFAESQMAGEVPNPEGDAALGYAVARSFANSLGSAITAQDRKLSTPVQLPRHKTVREERTGA